MLIVVTWVVIDAFFCQMGVLSGACRHCSDLINHSCCPFQEIHCSCSHHSSKLLNHYLWAQSGGCKDGRKHDAAYSSGFLGVILLPHLIFPVTFFQPFSFFVFRCSGAMPNITDAGVHALLLHIRCLGIFFNPLFSTWCFERFVQFNFEKTERKLFSLNQQEFLRETYSELSFNEPQGSAH